MIRIKFTTTDSDGNELRVTAQALKIKSYTVTEMDIKIRDMNGHNANLPSYLVDEIEEEAEERLLEEFYSKELEF